MDKTSNVDGAQSRHLMSPSWGLTIALQVLVRIIFNDSVLVELNTKKTGLASKFLLAG